MAVGPGQHLAVGRIGVEMQVEIVACVVDHCGLDVRCRAKLALLVLLHESVSGCISFG